MLLSVNDLRTHFRVGLDKVARAVDGLSFDLEAGKTLALVGESGCGKTQTAFSIIRLLAQNAFHPSGKIRFDGKDLFSLDEDQMRDLRGNDIAMIFQEPMTSLNPLYRIRDQLEEPLRLHQNLQKTEARQRAIDLLDRVGIPAPEKRIDNFPHELSGGMKQRVMIAMALACDPKLLIADEPTTALDVTIQAQVLRLMAELQQQSGMSILLITHDLGIVNQMADDIAIMYAGKIVETGTREQIFKNMAHPYTRRLFDSIPKPGDAPYLLNTIPGLVPSATDYEDNCRFSGRCPEVMEVCKQRDSEGILLDKGHRVYCHLFDGETTSRTALESPREPAPERPQFEEVLISIQSLKTHFPIHKGVFRRVAQYVKAVDDISLDIKKGSTLALVGESGCGKTTFGESILRLNREARGVVRYKGDNLMELPAPELKSIRKNLQIVFQDPFGSLSPRLTIEEIVGEGLQVHVPEISAEEKLQRVQQVLVEVGLNPQVVDRFPHEFSGGQRQRISIARALILEPEFLVLDEPTSALDVSVQAQVLNLLRELQSKRNLTYLFITHNLNVVRYIADWVGIMYLGRMVEYAPVKDLFEQPRHPYTQSLLAAVPDMDQRKPFEALLGDVPSPVNPPSGCYFHPRCPVFLNETPGSDLHTRCLQHYPESLRDGDSLVACHAAIKPTG